jgi:hypothetical protein
MLSTRDRDIGQVIHRLLVENENALVLFPTGGMYLFEGASITYRLW